VVSQVVDSDNTFSVSLILACESIGSRGTYVGLGSKSGAYKITSDVHYVLLSSVFRGERFAQGRIMKLSGLMLLTLSSVLPPFALAQSLPPDGGLLITRVNSEQWQIRLIAGTTHQQFSGVVESDVPITAVLSTRLESGDSAKLLTPTSLGAIFAVWPGGTDGVNFSASADAKLCLRDTGSSSVHMYLGNGLADAVPVTAPVALTSADACGDAIPPVPPVSARKYHPGHYTVMVKGADAQTFMATALQPGMVGIAKRYLWRSLEPTQGAYDFSMIKSDLAWAAANGTRLVVMIEYKTFKDEKAGPAYLDPYEFRNKAGGYTLELWSPVVIARYNALVKAFGAQVDSNSNFEGLGNQESSLSLDSATLKTLGYTPEKYRDALINMLSAATVSLPTSRVFWFMNFLVGNQSYIGAIAAAVAPLGVAMGGPDVWPDNQSLETGAYPYYTQFAGKMPLFIQCEDINYAQPHMTSGYATKDWTMPELYNFALTKLHVNYMFWMRVPKSVNSAAYNWNDALPVIAAHPTLN
jgi:hypothetical protein